MSLEGIEKEENDRITSLNKKVEYLNIDGFLRMVGEFGKFQILLDAIFCFMIIPTAFQSLIMYFAALQPEWRCVTNSTLCTLNGTFTSQNELRCQIPRSEWEFTQPKEYSIVTEFDIYCDKDWAIYMSTSIYFIGSLFGSIVLGWISDNYGRKNTLFTSYFFLLLSGLCVLFMPTLETFMICRFIVGFFKTGTIVTMYVLISEIVGEKYRPGAGIIFWFFFTVALCMMGLTAFFIRKWKILFIVSTAPYFIALLSYKFVPESVRWLRLKGKFEEALEIFKMIADWNGKKINPDVKISRVTVAKNSSSPMDLFKTKHMALKTTLQGFVWMVCAMVYLGISLAADELGGSLYRNYFLVSIVEFPAALLAIFCCDRLGRKKTCTYSLLLAGSLTLIVGFIPTASSEERMVRVAMGMLGKLFITISFDTICAWSVEMHTTDIRSEGMGFMQVTSRLGAASAPWIAKGVKSTHKSLPFIIMGSLGLIAGVACFFLPETKGREIQETEEDTSEMRLVNKPKK